MNGGTARNFLSRPLLFSQKVFKSSGECKVDIPPKLAVRKAFYKLKENQKKYQKNDGKPVWLKGGPMDKLLYQGTCVAVFVGIALSFYEIYKLSFKKTLFRD